VLPVLADIIRATPSGHLNFLVSKYGKSYTIEGFGKRFRQWTTKAGIAHCTPHGLRKAGAVRCAENGATAHELMAIFGWKDIKQAEHYTRKVVQRNLADGAMEKMAGGSITRTNLSHFQSRAEKGGKCSG
jgi:integrase